MRPPCEIVVKEILPAIRAMLVRDLVERYRLTQIEVAKKLGITQPAVSQYLRSSRGMRDARSVTIKNPKIMNRLRKLTDGIARGRLKQSQMIRYWCSICQMMGEEELFCIPHMREVPGLKEEECRICTPSWPTLPK